MRNVASESNKVVFDPRLVLAACALHLRPPAVGHGAEGHNADGGDGPHGGSDFDVILERMSGRRRRALKSLFPDVAPKALAEADDLIDRLFDEAYELAFDCRSGKAMPDEALRELLLRYPGLPVEAYQSALDHGALSTAAGDAGGEDQPTSDDDSCGE